MIAAGIERLSDYQDAAYARVYLDRLAPFADIERQYGDGSNRLLDETARQLALAMAYEDTVRVAELKIRPSRFARVREEVKVDDGQILEIAEFLHPRTQEIADTLPAGFGRWLLRTGWARGLVDRFTRKGRIVKTTSLSGFALLYLLARLKRWRRRSLRFAAEEASIVAWLRLVEDTGRSDYRLAVEIARAACAGDGLWRHPRPRRGQVCPAHVARAPAPRDARCRGRAGQADRSRARRRRRQGARPGGCLAQPVRVFFAPLTQARSELDALALIVPQTSFSLF